MIGASGLAVLALASMALAPNLAMLAIGVLLVGPAMRFTAWPASPT